MTGTFAVSSYASGVKQMSEGWCLVSLAAGVLTQYTDLGCSVEVAKVGQTLFLNGLGESRPLA